MPGSRLRGYGPVSIITTRDEQSPVGEPEPRKRRIIPLVSALLVLAFCGLPAVCQVVWGTPAGPLGPLIAYPFFTHPPASADKPPMLPDARNVNEAGSLEAGAKTLGYETAASPSTVFQFYRAALVKDGWGGIGYFPQPQITSEGVTFEWHQAGINGCETFGYRLQVTASEITTGTTYVQLSVIAFDPCA
jgi:hypothetical protein